MLCSRSFITVIPLGNLTAGIVVSNILWFIFVCSYWPKFQSGGIREVLVFRAIYSRTKVLNKVLDLSYPKLHEFRSSNWLSISNNFGVRLSLTVLEVPLLYSLCKVSCYDKGVRNFDDHMRVAVCSSYRYIYMSCTDKGRPERLSGAPNVSISFVALNCIAIYRLTSASMIVWKCKFRRLASSLSVFGRALLLVVCE